MRVVYDLRYATDHFPGIGTHAFALASELLARGRLSEITFVWNPWAQNTRFDLGPLRSADCVRWLDIDVPAMSASTAHRTGQLLTRLAPDLYLSPFWLRPEGTRVPCVLTLHDVIPLALKDGTNVARRWAYGWAMLRTSGAAAVLTSSRFSRDEILRLTRIHADRLHVVPLGVLPAGERMRRPANAPDGPFALTVGANRSHKGLDTLAAVWRDFDGAGRLELVGAGANAPERFSLVDAAREVRGIRALGQVAPEELEWLYRNATLVLVPSCYEGFGLPLLEAATRGTPIIASDIPALRETGEGVARFVAARDTGAWARAIRDLVGDAAARDRMRMAGFARSAEYSYAICAERVEALVSRLLPLAPRVPE